MSTIVSISEKRLKENREELTEKMMDVEGVEDDGDAIMKFIATKTERLVFTWPIRFHHFSLSLFTIRFTQLYLHFWTAVEKSFCIVNL